MTEDRALDAQLVQVYRAVTARFPQADVGLALRFALVRDGAPAIRAFVTLLHRYEQECSRLESTIESAIAALSAL